MFLPNPFELFAQGIVIGLMIVALALLDFIGRRCLAIEIDRRAIEGSGRAQAGGVLPRVERFVGRVAIGVDDVAMYRCTDDSGVGQQIGIQPTDVPVGIGARLAFGFSRLSMASGISVPPCGCASTTGPRPGLLPRSCIQVSATARVVECRDNLALEHHLFDRGDVIGQVAVSLERCYLCA